MGVESANYHYVPTADGSRELGGVLECMGAMRRPNDGGRFSHYVVSGPDHWLDLEVGPAGGLSYPSVSVRVALCNPEPALDVLRRLLSMLLAEGGGYVIDRPADQRVSDLDEESWHRLRSGYAAKREEFREHFGDFEAPISGEDVFRRLRDRSI